MPFIPRSAQDALDSMLAKLMVRTKISAPDPKSNTYLIFKTISEVVAAAEYRIWQYRNSFNLANPNISYDDLLARVAELPPGGVNVLSKTNASGAVLTVSRKSAAAEQILPVGSSVQRKDAAGSGLTYRTLVPYTFAIGVDSLAGCYVACTEAGERGNCGIGVLTRGVNMPSWVTGVTNDQPLTNGQETELPAALQMRAIQYLSSLARSQRTALEFLAKSFVSTDGTKAKFAKLFFDPATPGYAELVVDDGTGFTSLVQVGPTVSGVAGPSGQSILVHQGPATAEIPTVKLTTGGVVYLTSLANGDFQSFPELGYVKFPNTQQVPTDIYPSTVWEISNYSVYVGYLAELQRAVDGDTSDPVTWPGWKAEGVRIRVVPPTVEYTDMQVHVVPVSYADLATLQEQVTNVILSFCANLGPGEPLYISSLNAAVRVLPNVLNIQFFYTDGSNAPKGDVYAQPKQVIRTKASLIQYVASV